MGFFTRRLVPFAAFTALVLASSPDRLAFAQTPASTATPPPPGGGGGAPAAAPADSSAAGAPATKGEVGGFTFNDKPSATRGAPAPRFVHRAGGPQATFPGFEQLTDGGSRLFVQLSQTVPVEQRVAQGSVTYVLKGAHLRVHNDSNALVTVHFNTPVYRARLMPSGNDLLFVLELRSAATPTFKVQDNADKTSTLTIDFAKGDFVSAADNGDVPQNAQAVDGNGHPMATPAPRNNAFATHPATVRRGGRVRAAPVTTGPTP